MTGMVGLTALLTVQAHAQTICWDVCVYPSDFVLDDADGDTLPSAGDGATAVGKIFPEGTIPAGGIDDCTGIIEPPIGTFFARGRIVAGLPSAAADDFAYVDWQFRVDGSGEMETTGVTKAAPMYPHTIIGTTNEMYPDDGEMTVEVLDAGGFQIRTCFDLEEEDDTGGGDGGTTTADCNSDGVINGLDIIGAGCP
jgi:hypothetical protein